MKIQIFSVALDGDGRSILEEDFSRDYDGLDRLDTPAKIVAVMEEVFHLSDRAEEYMYLICMNAGCKPICLFEVSHGTHDSTLVGIREIFVCYCNIGIGREPGQLRPGFSVPETIQKRMRRESRGKRGKRYGRNDSGHL